MPNGPAMPTRGIGERRLERAEHVARSASIEPSMARTMRPRRPAEPGVARGAPSRCRGSSGDDLDVVAERAWVGRR